MSSAERRPRRRRIRELLASASASASASSSACSHERGRRLRSRAAGEGGFLLVEVMVSVMLVALIAIATFNGFDVANRISADQRRHSEAQLLAAQSQEQLRSDPATALDALETASHTYTKTVNGTEFTIIQEAKPVSAAGSTTGCTIGEASAEHGANVLVTSTVTWTLQNKMKLPAVKQASIITPPIGSALEVDVSNGWLPPEPVSGVTAIASFVPEGAPTTNHAEGTTGAAGCVVLSGLASTEATVEIARKLNFVSTASLLKYPTKEVTIVPNLTTQYPVTYAEGGRIKAEFTYKGATEFEKQAVTSDTFVVTNSEIPAGYTKWLLGGTGFEYEAGGEEQYKSVTGSYSSTAFTPVATQYTKGLLFPFPSGWTVYAGDCPKNAVATEAETSVSAFKGGELGIAKIPLSYLNLEVRVGTQAKPEGLSATSYPATVTNTECESYENPLHAYGKNVKHAQTTTTTGHLSNPFQPFGAAKVCVYSATVKRTYTTSYSLPTAAGVTKSIYLGEISNEEKATAREKEEATKLAEEKAKIEQWKKEEKEGKLTKAKREELEKAAKKAREAENTAKQTAESEEIAKKEVEVRSSTSC